MRILLLTYGSRGDVQPFLSLSVALQNKGYEVTLAAPHRFEEWVASFGVPFIPLAGEPDIISLRLNEAGQNPLGMLNAMMKYILSIADQVILQIYAACKDSDLIVQSFLFTTGAHSIAKAFGIPDVSLQTFPIFAPTKEIAPVFMPQIKNGVFRYFLHWLAIQVFWHFGNMGYRRIARRNQYVPEILLHWPFSEEIGFTKSPIIFAFSPSIVPCPVDWKQSHIHVCGYLFLKDEGEELSAELEDFLNQGKAPVCISFGSLIHKTLPEIIQKILQACRQMDMRVVLLSGWEEYKKINSSQDVLITTEAPHETLFPKCSMIIHHGGAGTTAAALRSGVPNLVIPFGADQLFWGLKVHELGAGPAPIPENKVSVQRIIGAIEFAGQAVIRNQAKSIANDIVHEDGIAHVIQIIESKIPK